MVLGISKPILPSENNVNNIESKQNDLIFVRLYFVRHFCEWIFRLKCERTFNAIILSLGTSVKRKEVRTWQGSHFKRETLTVICALCAGLLKLSEKRVESLMIFTLRENLIWSPFAQAAKQMCRKRSDFMRKYSR